MFYEPMKHERVRAVAVDELSFNRMGQVDDGDGIHGAFLQFKRIRKEKERERERGKGRKLTWAQIPHPIQLISDISEILEVLVTVTHSFPVLNSKVRI